MVVIAQLAPYGKGGEGKFGELTELDENFSKVVRVSRPCEEAHITHLAFVGRVVPKQVFLNVGDALHQEANGKHDASGNIASGAKIGLVVFGHVRRIQ